MQSCQRKKERQVGKIVIAQIGFFFFFYNFMFKDIYTFQHSESKDYSFITTGREHVINENSAFSTGSYLIILVALKDLVN